MKHENDKSKFLSVFVIATTAVMLIIFLLFNIAMRLLLLKERMRSELRTTLQYHECAH
jgi:hypothetical protein